MKNQTLGNCNYNGVVVKLVVKEGMFFTTVEYSKHWKEKGFKDRAIYHEDEDLARFRFRNLVKDNISIY